MPLSLQDKLALSMTSAASMRSLAATIGVSHQRLGRWLREGHPALIDPETGYLIHSAGIKQIPPEYTNAINFAFSLHKQVTRDQARADGIPYLEQFPIFSFRGVLRTGEKGERVFMENTTYIEKGLRTDILETYQRTRRFHNASVRSVVNFRRYSERRVVDEIRETGRRISKKKLTGYIMESFMQEHKKILPTDETLPIYTKYENFGRGVNAVKAVKAINDKLIQKHETAAIDLADQFLLQLIPAKKNEKPRKRKATRSPLFKRK